MGGRRSTRRAAVTAVAVITVAVTATCAAAARFGVVPSPNPGESNTIGGLVAFSPSEIWAVGSSSSHRYEGCHGRTLAARWDGRAFVEVLSPPTSMCASVEGVTGTSTRDIWAVGSTNSGRDTHLRHWDGSVWTTVPGASIAPPPSGGRSQRSTGLHAVAAVSSNDVWAVGRAQFSDFSRHSLIERWDGSAWRLVDGPTATGSELFGVAALGASDAWAVGHAGGSGGPKTLAVHWDGTRWTVVPSPNTNASNTLRGVAAVAPDDVWAVGSSIKDPFDGFSVSHTLIEHWDGSSWSVVPSPNVGGGSNVLFAVSARRANDIWAVGHWIDVTGDIPTMQTLVLRWNGARWARVRSANVGPGDNSLTAVVAPAGTKDVWASGWSAEGTLVERLVR
jgi:hypothetical protein